MNIRFMSLGLVLLGPLAARATDYYVAANGGLDTNSGKTINEALKTPNKAVEKAQPGDTIYVRAGDYFEENKILKSGEPGKPITLRNYQNEVPRLGRLTIGIHDKFHTIGWINVIGIEIVGRTGTPGGIGLWNAHDVNILGNNIHDTDANGITGGGFRIKIVGNRIVRSGSCNPGCHGHGMYLTGNDILIANNVVIESAGFGLQVAGYPYDCRLYAGGIACSYWSIPSEEYAGARHFKVYNNLFALSKGKDGLVLWQPWAKDNFIKNNIFYQNGSSVGAGTGVTCVGSPGPGNDIDNNLFVNGPGNVGTGISTSCTGKYTASGNKTGAPLFKDVANFDFHLTSTASAANNAGLNLFSEGITDDYDRKPRPNSGAFEIGPYEFGGLAPPPRKPGSPSQFEVR